MEHVHRDKIRKNIKRLSTIKNIEQLYEELIAKRIVFPNDVEKIKANVSPKSMPSKIWSLIISFRYLFQKNYLIASDQAQEFFLLYTKRGPDAFGILINALRRVGNTDEANTLAEGLDLSSVRGYEHYEDDTASSGYGESIEASPPSSSTASGSGVGFVRPHSASTT